MCLPLGYLEPEEPGFERQETVAQILERFPKPETTDNGRWAIGVVTAPRSAGSIQPTLDSLRINRWEPTVFAEPGSTVPDGVNVVWNEERLGNYHNWRQTCQRLLDANPDAEWIMTVQDDAILCPDAREIAEKHLNDHPTMKVGCVTFYTSFIYLLGANRPGFYKIAQNGLWGAVCVAFPRSSLVKILDHPMGKDWWGWMKKREEVPKQEVIGDDTFIGKVCNQLSLPVFGFQPSLCQHVAQISSIHLPKEDGKPRRDRRGGRSARCIAASPDAFKGNGLPKAVIVGSGRHGSGFIAQVLRRCGVPCGHEDVYDLEVVPCGLDVDSSWLAMPRLEKQRSGIRVFHQWRNPLRVLTSMMGKELEDGVGVQYMNFRKRCSPAQAPRNPQDRLRFFVESLANWLKRCDAISEYSYSIDDITPQDVMRIADAAGITVMEDEAREALTSVPKNVNRGKAVPQVTWDDITGMPGAEYLKERAYS